MIKNTLFFSDKEKKALSNKSHAVPFGKMKIINKAAIIEKGGK